MIAPRFQSTSPVPHGDRPVVIPSFVTPVVRPVPVVWTDSGWRPSGPPLKRRDE